MDDDRSDSYEVGKRLCFYPHSVNVQREIQRYIKHQCGAMAVAGACPFLKSPHILPIISRLVIGLGLIRSVKYAQVLE